MENKYVALALAITAVVTVVVTVAILTYTVRIKGHGKIRTIGVGVFSDSGASLPVTEINWGTLSPTETAKVTLYIKNTGNSPCNLTLLNENWTPANSDQYFTLSWTYDGKTLTVGEVYMVDLSLTVHGNIHDINDFSFDIIVIAQG